MCSTILLYDIYDVLFEKLHLIPGANQLIMHNVFILIIGGLPLCVSLNFNLIFTTCCRELNFNTPNMIEKAQILIFWEGLNKLQHIFPYNVPPRTGWGDEEGHMCLF